MYIIKNWHLTMRGYVVIGYGYCFGNPKFPEGLHILTQPIVTVEVDHENEQLKLFTKSGRCYLLGFVDVDGSKVWACGGTNEILSKWDIHLDFEKYLEQKWKNEEYMQNWLSDILDCRELYVQLVGTHRVCRAFYKPGKGEVVELPVRVHTEMYQNNVIISGTACDWRFYVEDGINCYHWDGELDTVRIENIGDDICYRGSRMYFHCRKGETIVVPKEEFDPDAFHRSKMLCQSEIDTLFELLGQQDKAMEDISALAVNQRIRRINNKQKE